MKTTARIMIAACTAATLLTAAGCCLTGKGGTAGAAKAAPGADRTEEAALGKHIREVIAAAEGRRMRFFAADGEELDALPEGVAGSVSIYTAEGDSQDNYTFDADGRIIRHLRSHGENYAQGVWEPVE
jgi:hypothetical protein